MEISLTGMDLKIAFAVNYDPLHVISSRIQVNKNKPSEHQEFEGFARKAHWLDYRVPRENVEILEENPLAMVKSSKVIAPISSTTEASTKRTFSEAMETKEEEASSDTNKRHKVETKRYLVEFVKAEAQKKQVKIKGPVFEMQQYEFSEVSQTSTDRFRSRTELYDKNKNDR